MSTYKEDYKEDRNDIIYKDAISTTETELKDWKNEVKHLENILNNPKKFPKSVVEQSQNDIQHIKNFEREAKERLENNIKVYENYKKSKEAKEAKEAKKIKKEKKEDQLTLQELNEMARRVNEEEIEEQIKEQFEERKILFDRISSLLKQRINLEWIESVKTIKGNTQSSERLVIQKIKQVFDELKLSYEEAGSQQSKDFRNVGGIGLDIEIKKTDNTTIYFNDTCPSSDIYYVIVFTGKIYKRSPQSNIPGQVLCLNGSEFLKDCDWLNEFNAKLTTLKNEYARGENKKQLSGIISVYPRPTYKADISSFLSFLSS